MAAACAVRVMLVSWRFIIPLVIFVFCYWKIISSLRHRAKVAASQRQRQQQQPAAGPSTSTAASSRQSKAPSKTQKNIIKTMIIIISCFIVSWLPPQFMIVVMFCDSSLFTSVALHYFSYFFVTVIYFCANPFIYATGMYPFLREKFVASLRRLRRLVCGGNQVADVAEQHAGTSNLSKRH